ncbi:MAG: SBBP repeat-containing protein [Candidatus Hodarchaeales archaeon]|jgi:hypothetical protein
MDFKSNRNSCSRLYVILLTFVILGSISIFNFNEINNLENGTSQNITNSVLEKFLNMKPSNKAQNIQFNDINESFNMFTGFKENDGQEPNSEIMFYYGSKSSSIGFSKSKIYFSKELNSKSPSKEKILYNITFFESNSIDPVGSIEMAHSSNYFMNDIGTSVESFKEIWYYNIYEKIDLRYFMSENGLKYEFIVHPGGDPNNIIITASSNIKLQIQKEKVLYYSNTYHNVELEVDSGLYVFQSSNNKILSNYQSINHLKNSYGFDIPEFNPEETLIIDPYWLKFSTFIGGSGNDIGEGIAVDSSGNSYITGMTSSINFPTLNGYNTSNNGGYDVFLIKMNATGNGIVFSTYIGGTGDDKGLALALDTNGNCYITGETSSNDFPTYQSYDNSSNGGKDVFVTKINSTGNGIIFSTYLGGSEDDIGRSIDIDDSNNAYITGNTGSSNYPVVSAYDSTYNGWIPAYYDVFVSKLNASGNGISFSTYIGHDFPELGSGIAVDSEGNSFIVGYTSSQGFPLYNPYDGNHNYSQEAFILKLNSTGNGLIFSTFLGGSNREFGYDIEIDSSGNSFITGGTESTDFPTVQAYDTSFGGGFVGGDCVCDSFLAKLNATGNGLIFSTYLGGSSNEVGNSIVVDPVGNSFITGYSWSGDFPTTQNAYDPSHNGAADTFVTKINSTGNGLIYSTYVGGWADIDEGNGIAIDSEGSVFVTGNTMSINFPRVNAYDDSNNGGQEVIFYKISSFSDDDPSSFSLTSPVNNSVQLPNTMITVEISDNGDLSKIRYHWDSAYNSTWSSSTLTTPLPITDGQHILYVYTQDLAGNWGSDWYIFTTDSISPDIGLVILSNASYQKPGTFVDIQITDSNNLTSVLYNWDSSTNQTWLLTPFNTTLPILDGQHLLRVYAKDEVGNWGYKLFSFTTDSILPTIILFNPANNSIKQSNFNIQLNVTDDNGIFDVIFNWDDQSNSSITTYSVNLPAGEGIHTLIIFVVDLAGNLQKNVYIFYTDDISPQIGLLSPVKDSINKSGTIIKLNITDDNSITEILYNWDFTTNQTFSYPFETFLPINDGNHILYIHTRDIADNWESKSFQFKTDDTSPLIELLIPNNGSIHFSEYVIELSITDLNNFQEIMYNWDENANTTFNQQFLTQLPSIEGQHTLNVFAIDIAGNLNVSMFIFETDDTLPEVTLYSLTNYTTLQSMSEISFNVSDNKAVDIVYFNWDYFSNNTINSPYSTSLPTLDGTHTLNIIVRDIAGNWLYKSYVFIADNTPIALIGVNPLNNTVHKNGTMIELQFDELPDEKYYSWDNQNNVSILDPLPQVDGWHSLKIWLKDSVGNWNYYFLKYYTDDDPLQFTSFSLDNGSAHVSSTIINITFNEIPVTIRFAWDNQLETIITNNSISFITLEVPVGDGNHSLVITAQHEVGYIVTEVFSVITDDIPIVISINTISNGSAIVSGISINLDFSEAPITEYYSWDDSENSTFIEDVPTGDGLHKLHVWVQSHLHWTYEVFYFYVDDTPISITLVSHVNGSILNSGNIIQLNFNETPINQIYSWDNSPNSTVLFSIPSGDGWHKLKVWVNDRIRWSYQEFMFKVDDTNPIINVYGLQSEISGSITITIEITDASNIEKFQIWIDDELKVNTSGNEFEFTFNSQFFDIGEHRLRILAEDQTGNQQLFEQFLLFFTEDSTSTFMDTTSTTSSNKPRISTTESQEEGTEEATTGLPMISFILSILFIIYTRRKK